MDDGTEGTVGPGDVVLIEPGYDAWVIGDEACVMYDTGMTATPSPVVIREVGSVSGGAVPPPGKVVTS